MAIPAIIWRNPTVLRRRRIWNQARHNATGRLYIVVRSAPGDQGGWEGLPNLEVIEGGASARRKSANRSTQSSA
jgi:hypothetical protein